jgi:hypothetical protein
MGTPGENQSEMESGRSGYGRTTFDYYRADEGDDAEGIEKRKIVLYGGFGNADEA